MEGLFYNVKNGSAAACSSHKLILIAFSYIEGIVRGYRNALLTSQNYSNLTQCETIDGRLMSIDRQEPRTDPVQT